MIGKFLTILNLNQLFFKLNQFICNKLPVLPDHMSLRTTMEGWKTEVPTEHYQHTMSFLTPNAQATVVFHSSMDLRGVCLVSGQFRGIREGLLHGLENHDATRSSMFHFVIHVGGGNFTAQPRRIYGRRHPTSWDRFGFTKVAGISLFIWGQWTRFGPMSDGLRP